MTKLRVLVVEDSLTVRKHLCEIIAADPALEVIGEAGDGKRAIQLCGELKPDVMTLDMILPVMSGLAATEFIMAHHPTPILVVSSSTNRGELFKTYEALSAGAVDVLDKPRGDESAGEWEKRFVDTIKMVARIRVITHPRARLGFLGRAPSSAPSERPLVPVSDRMELVAIGASTGGPGAIVDVLRGLPVVPSVPIFLVLHIGDTFASAFVDWLDGQTSHRVVAGVDGERVAAYHGKVCTAPPGKHLVVRDGRVRLTSEPERHSCRPSIDVLFESLARERGGSVAACLLTGMGRDGAQGLLEIRRAGGFTIAQDEASSVVYGMPREAVALGAAAKVLPLSEIGSALASAIGGT